MSFRFPSRKADLERGQERYNIYCTPCHDYVGNSYGFIVQRGFPLPASYHIQRLREAPAGHFFGVITNGMGAMYSYADRIDPADRWRIVAYIRVLQASRNAHLSDVPEAERQKLDAATNRARRRTAAIGATATAMTSSDAVRPTLDRLQRNALVCGIIGVVLVLLIGMRDTQQFFRSYLFAFVYWICDPARLHRRPDAASPHGRLVGTADPPHSRGGLANDAVDGRPVYSRCSSECPSFTSGQTPRLCRPTRFSRTSAGG